METAEGRAIAVRADVQDYDAIRRMIDRTAHAFGGLRVVVNSAGISAGATVDEVTLAEWNDVVAVNLTSAFSATKAALAHLKRDRGGASSTSPHCAL